MGAARFFSEPPLQLSCTALTTFGARLLCEVAEKPDAGLTPVTRSSSRARVQATQMSFGIVNLFEIRVVRDSLDALRGWNDLVVTRHNGDGAKLQALSQMHRGDREPAGCDFDFVAEFDRLNSSSFDGVSCPSKLARRADKHTNFVRLNPMFNLA